MRKLIMWNIVTLDGYFEGEKNWDLSFHDFVWGPELQRMSTDILKSTDYLVFGRVTYEGMAAYWKTATGEIAALMNQLPKIVFSRTLSSVDWNNTTLVKDNVSEEIRNLKSVAGKDIYVFGICFIGNTHQREPLRRIQNLRGTGLWRKRKTFVSSGSPSEKVVTHFLRSIACGWCGLKL